VGAIPIAATLLLAACSPSPPPECVFAGSGDAATPPDPATVGEFRQSIEAGPLYAMAADEGALAACRISREATRLVLEYSFANGASLRAERDPTIEYAEQDVRFASPREADPAAALARAEQASFGASGCGIDWRQGTAEPAAAAPSAETVYRGDLCNCQARVRRDAAGRVVGLIFRSAC
jgi:hypothetical protein